MLGSILMFYCRREIKKLIKVSENYFLHNTESAVCVKSCGCVLSMSLNVERIQMRKPSKAILKITREAIMLLFRCRLFAKHIIIYLS